MTTTNDDLTRIGQAGATQHASANQKASDWQTRDIALLRKTLSMLCNFVWNRETRPGEHLWSIPVDKERDFDCIISDAISELEALRAENLAMRKAAAGLYRGFENESLNGVVCSIPDGGLDTPPHRTWCAGCQRRWQGLKALGEASALPELPR